MKKVSILLVLFLFLFVLPCFYLFNYSQSITLTDKKVTYELPHPGILPDHPLYIFKTARDKGLDALTRDNVKKAELYLLFSDKRVKMAELLAKKGKATLAISTLSKGEKYFLKIPGLLVSSKKQGKGATQEFIDRLRSSNQKHREVIEQLLKDLPQGDQEGLNDVLRLNDEAYSALSSL